MSEDKNELGRADIFGAGEYLQRSDESMLFDTADWDEMGDGNIDNINKFRAVEGLSFIETGAAVVIGKRLHALHDALALVDSGRGYDGDVRAVLTQQIREENMAILHALQKKAGQWVFDLMEEEASGPGDVSITHPETVERLSKAFRRGMDENAKGGH